VWARWEASIRQPRGFAGRLPEPVPVDEVERLARRFVSGRAALFEERIRGCYIVDGHGDLLADDIFCTGDGVRILDCLEFDDRLRWVDGLDDAAFLAMDLERLGAAGLAEKFTGWYAGYSADPAPAALRHHYLAYRAFVRAKIAFLHAAHGDSLGGAEAQQLTGLTLRHLRAGAVTLVLAGRLPGDQEDRAGQGAGRPARVHRAQQRPDPQGAGRRPGGTALRRAVADQDLRPSVDGTHLPGAAPPRAVCSLAANQ
jgi:hypothetical protein